MADRVLREKHVAHIGRWRFAWRFGHYRTGLHRYAHTQGHWTGGLPFMWWSVIVKDRGRV